jgi:hypothetical protein
MSKRRSAFRRAWMLLCILALAACVLAVPSQADPYGEITRFGEKGIGAGQLELPEAAFGVDQTDNSIYVVDSTKEGREFRLQKFEKVSGKYSAVASATFKPKDAAGEEEDEVEGVAIDSKTKRAYLLVSESRPPLKGEERHDQFDEAASELYAFSTVQNGSKLEPVEGTEEGGVLVGVKTLLPLSNNPGVSMLEPGGIAVNPTNDHILIVAHEDRGKLGKEEEATTIVQDVEPNGTLGTRYVDQGNFFEECDCANSPVVTPTGQIYVLGEEDEIDEIPSNLSSATAPKRLFQMPVPANCTEAECPYVESLTTFPGPGGEGGAQMSLGADGRIFVRNRIKLASEGGFSFGGVMILSPTFVEQGWVGGGSSTGEACSVNELSTAKPAVAAGKEEVVFMLSRNAKTPKIVELGPGGGNCPKGTATTPTAKAGGIEVEPVPIADKVTFSSTVTQANAVSVEWEFGDGSATQTVGARQQETTLVEHKFLKAGKLTVKEKIHTDNLATPVIEKERQIEIVGAPTIRGEEAAVAGTGATLTAEVDPHEKKAQCRFEYGPVGEAFPTKEKVPCAEELGAVEEFVSISTKLSGLTKGAEYHFRLWVKSSSGEEALGKGTTFTVTPTPPLVETKPASGLGETAASLNATVDPEEEATECHFQWGTTASYGKEAPCSVKPGSGTSPVTESSALGGLAPGTVYHYRIVAVSGAGTSNGHDVEFKTAPKPEPPKEAPKEEPRPAPGPGGGVLPETKAKPVPVVTIAGSSVSVAKTGAFPLKLSCPGEESSCSGTVSVKTLTAVAARRATASKRKAILTLATSSFTLVGGKLKAVTLHLSAKGRALLARSHTLRVRVTIAARDPQGGAHTTVAVVTLKAAKHH